MTEISIELRDIIASAIQQVATTRENQELIKKCSVSVEIRPWMLPSEIEELTSNITQELYPLYQSLANILTNQRTLITESFELCQSGAGKLTECRAFGDI